MFNYVSLRTTHPLCILICSRVLVVTVCAVVVVMFVLFDTMLLCSPYYICIINSVVLFYAVQQVLVN